MIDLTGKKALVLGGSRGIGAASARKLAEQGAAVAITYAHSADRAEAVVTEIRAAGGTAVAIAADAYQSGASAAAVAKTVEALGGLDILVATAGIFDTAPLSDMDAARYEKSFDIHVRSVLEAARAAAGHMTRGGSIVTFGSILGDVTPFPGLTLYTASKAAETALTKALARELGSSGVRANAVQPGPINTEMNPADTDVNPMADTQAGMTALGRYGTPEEVANLVAFLASDDAAYITGQAINIDGGWTA